MTDQLHGDIQAAIEAGKQLCNGEDSLFYIEGVPHVVVPNGMQLQNLKNLLGAPMHIQQRVATSDASSFIAYYNRFAGEASLVFCDLENATFVGVIDYHASQDDPAWGDHRVFHTCQPTEEWKAWNKKNGEHMSQIDFAFFIEQNADEIREPDSATMLEIATTLKASTKTSFESGQRLQNGQVQFKYHEEIDGKAGSAGQVSIPESFKLGMRVFEGGDAFELEARFRYRIKDGNVSMWYDLVRPTKVHRAAVESVYEQINAGVDSMMLNGSI